MPHPPFITLSDAVREPLYRQIYNTIRRSILSGEFCPGRQLPASRQLARQLSVSRMTVINAYEQLFAEGYLETRLGAGTYVAEHLPEEFLNAPDTIKEKRAAHPIPPRRLKFSTYGSNLLRTRESILRTNQTSPPVPFQHGLAAIEEFPFEVWNKLVSKTYRTVARDQFGYGEPAGYFPLRRAIAAHLKSARGVNCVPEQVIITSSAQHCFDLIGRVLLEAGTRVLIEDPCYFGVKQSFESFKTEIIPVAVDENGFDLKSISEKQRTGARLAYVTPSHQFPLGSTLSLQRRMELLEWARNTESWIVEDDYDSEFRYKGRPLPSLQGLDQAGRVLYVGTFSKTIFPALRLGCLVVPPDLIEIFTVARAVSGTQAPLVDQAVLAEFITGGHLSRHIRRMRTLYEERQAVLIYELQKQFGNLLEVDAAVAGMHLVAWLPEGISDLAVVERAAASGLRVASVSFHRLRAAGRCGLILGYTAINHHQIKKGVKQLAKIIKNIER